MENAYIAYYSVQVGSGLKEIGPLYHNIRFVQQGRGFGSFFQTLFNYLKPVVQSGISALKDSALKTGSSMLTELGSRPIKEILTDHGKKFGEDLGSKLKKKFQGGSGLIFAGAARRKPKQNGIKGRISKKKNQSTTKRKPVKRSKKSKRKSAKTKLKTRVLDIFSK